MSIFLNILKYRIKYLHMSWKLGCISLKTPQLKCSSFVDLPRRRDFGLPGPQGSRKWCRPRGTRSARRKKMSPTCDVEESGPIRSTISSTSLVKTMVHLTDTFHASYWDCLGTDVYDVYDWYCPSCKQSKRAWASCWPCWQSSYTCCHILDHSFGGNCRPTSMFWQGR